MSFPVPSALLTGRVVRRSPGALLCSGWRAEGVSGFSVLMQGLINANLVLSFLGSWSGLTLDYSGSISGSGITLAQQVDGGIAAIRQRY